MIIVLDKEYVFELRSLSFIFQVSVVSLVIALILLALFNINIYFLLLIPFISIVVAVALFGKKKIVINDKRIKAFDVLGNPHQINWKKINQVKVFGMSGCCQYLQLQGNEEKTIWLPLFLKNKKDLKKRLNELSIPRETLSKIEKYL